MVTLRARVLAVGLNDLMSLDLCVIRLAESTQNERLLCLIDKEKRALVTSREKQTSSHRWLAVTHYQAAGPARYRYGL
jgi:hypothetical protein